MGDYDKFKELLLSTRRLGVGDLVQFLDLTDFKSAPASAKYHLDCEGGLCKHSLNVYDNLVKLIDMYKLPIDNNSAIIAALLHDLSKINFYEKVYQNKKLYSANGSKYDDGGRFDWVSVESYRVKDPQERFVAADHGTNSFMIASRYIAMTDEEIIAIINHHAGMDNGFVNKDLNAIYDKYPLASLLHIADMLSVYINENEQVNKTRTSES